MNASVGLYVAITPVVAGCLGAILVFLTRTRAYREAAGRSNRHRTEIDRILLDARIREAKEREARALPES